VSLLTIADTSPEDLRRMLDLGAAVKADPEAYRTALAGRSIGLFFQKQSLRTWVSCDVAAIQLGIHPIVIRNDQTGMGSRETPEDVGRVLDRYLDLLAMRVFDHGTWWPSTPSPRCRWSTCSPISNTRARRWPTS
jgi:ornithine carbamoyltransferase